jgi:hypothetical protein
LLGFTHCTTEHGRKLGFALVTVNVSAGLPAAAEVCDSELIVGAASPVVGVESVKGRDPEAPSEFVTVTAAVPGNAVWVAGIEAVSCVALTKVVGCAVPFQFTVASLVKFVPLTVSVNPCGLQYGVKAAAVVDADTEVIVGGVPGGVLMVKSTTFEISVVVVLLTFDVPD